MTTKQFTWPLENTAPTPEMPLYCSGLYSKDPCNVSPEGNVYGQTRRVLMVKHYVWWNGEAWRDIEIAGRADSLDRLPTGPRPFGQIWQAREYVAADNTYLWREYYWDSQTAVWRPLIWLWVVDDATELPARGRLVGEAHFVIEWDVPAFWDGLVWRREDHSKLLDDEPHKHLPPGFMETLIPDVRLVFVSPTELAVEPVQGGSGRAWINGEWVAASPTAAVFSNLAVLEWDSQDQRIVPTYLSPDTEYWVYWANTKDSAFTVAGMPGDGIHHAAPAWDYRGKLFLSRSAPQNQVLSLHGSGRSARLAGRIQTDGRGATEGGPGFLKELNISLISNRPSLPEAFREYSDYVVEFSDQDSLVLRKHSGLYGQLAIAGKLEFLGSDYVIERSAAWIEWDAELSNRVALRNDPLVADTTYYIYIAADLDPFNFNTVNRDAQRPWQATDEGSETAYDPNLDWRLKPFLCPKVPDHGLLAEEWPGYYTRHIGQVRTDGNGRFTNARDLSQIRQPTLNPTHFDGLAEIAIIPIDETEFRICRAGGTSGIVNVGGSAVQTYEQEHAGVHRVRTSDLVQDYDEANLAAPLSASNAVSAYPEQDLYVYLANERTCWGQLATRTFVSRTAPKQGYLSRNWPGSNARWLMRIRPDAAGQFTGSFIPEAIAHAPQTMDDFSVSLSRVWSSSRICAEVDRGVRDAGREGQKRLGLPVRLTYLDAGHVKLVRVGDDGTILLANGEELVVGSSGLTLAVQGSPNILYYVYANPSGLFMSSTAPTTVYEQLQMNATGALLVGWVVLSAANTIAGEWNVCSLCHEPEREWSQSITSETTTLSLPGLVIPPNGSARLTRTGQDAASGTLKYALSDWAGWLTAHATVVTGTTIAEGKEDSTCWIRVNASATLSHGNVAAGIYSQFTLTHALSVTKGSNKYTTIMDQAWKSFSGALTLTRHGSHRRVI